MKGDIAMEDLTPMEYVGQGVGLIGVPARDLTVDDVARLPDRLIRRLTSSGLYRPIRPAKGSKEAHEHE